LLRGLDRRRLLLFLGKRRGRNQNRRGHRRAYEHPHIPPPHCCSGASRRAGGSGSLGCASPKGRRPPALRSSPGSHASCLSIVSASLTSNFPGASTLTCLTTPSSTRSENRRVRTPIPGISISRPSLRASSAEPSPS